MLICQDACKNNGHLETREVSPSATDMPTHADKKEPYRKLVKAKYIKMLTCADRDCQKPTQALLL